MIDVHIQVDAYVCPSFLNFCLMQFSRAISARKFDHVHVTTVSVQFHYIIQ